MKDITGRDSIVIKNANENNLKGISLTIPRNEIVVVTGMSGSGKSSLAFNTIYAEGQRRYIEGLSAYARQYIGMMKKPDVDYIEGLSPAISIEQKNLNHNPRSTVGTLTEIYDYMRLLFAKLGIQYCVHCNIPVIKRTQEQIVATIQKEYANDNVILLAPIVYARKGSYTELFVNLLLQGFTRARIDGKIVPLKSDLALTRYKNHDIELVVDCCPINEENEKRLNTSVTTCLKKGSGVLFAIRESDAENNENNESNLQIFSIHNSCPKCHTAYRTLAPNSFSFNSPYGCCLTCKGLGQIEKFDPDLLIPDKSLSITDGAVQVLGKKASTWLWTRVNIFAKKYNIPLDIPITEFPQELLDTFLFGVDSSEKGFNGFIPSLQAMYEDAYSNSQQREMDEFRKVEVCPECAGARLKEQSRFVRLSNKSIFDLTSMDIDECRAWFAKYSKKLNKTEKAIASQIVKEIGDRLGFLSNVGLSYLSLNRSSMSLSGGEFQRIHLASQIGAQLIGITYVLDEPSIGLHAHDSKKLISAIKDLKNLGNSIIIVEHDKSIIESADHIVDLGERAGIHGGELLFNTPTKKLDKISQEVKDKSLTYQYLSGTKTIQRKGELRTPIEGQSIKIINCTGNNLKNLDLEIPLGLFIVVTGVSGSGKSSLINDTLFPILSNKLHHTALHPLPYSQVIGLDGFGKDKLVDKVIEIDQSAIGRTPRSNPATYTKLFDIIRTYYSELPEAKMRGYKPGRFSFNVSGGRCDVCEGAGVRRLEMNFLPDVYVTCDTCGGKRYNNETLSVKFKNKSISDVLNMSVEEALIFFENIPKLRNKLQVLNDVGLGYIKLGQQAPTLSGGEAQRVKLATELSRPSTGKTIFLLDEPTTGLHFEDIRLLLNVLQKLVDKGNTVIVIEHNMDVIKCADWLIDLGPEGGRSGGEIVAVGSPIDIKNNSNSLTGKYLLKEIK